MAESDLKQKDRALDDSPETSVYTETEGLTVDEIIGEAVRTDENAELYELYGSDGVIAEFDAADKLSRELDEATQMFEQLSLVELPKPRAVSDMQQRARAGRKRRYYMGMASAALSLLFMGIAMTVLLNSPAGIISAFRLAPVMLVFLGAEIGITLFLRRNTRVKLNMPAVGIMAATAVITFGLSAVSARADVDGETKNIVTERLEDRLIDDIVKKAADVRFRDITLTLTVNEANAAFYGDIGDIESTDTADIRVEFFPQGSVGLFAEDCRTVLDIMREHTVSYRNVEFIAKDRFNNIHVTLNGRFATDMTVDEIASITYYFGELQDGEQAEDVEDITDPDPNGE